MHYSVLVVVDEPTSEAIEEVMQPYGDSREWDWYQVGGRWTGLFDGYDPEKDERNIVVCDLCNGTGTRPDMRCRNGCNGCQGKGKHTAWPTQWKQHPGDILPIEQLTQEHLSKFHAVCTESGWYGGEEYVPWEQDVSARFKQREMPPLEWLKEQGKYAVVVDCHN